MNEKIAKKEMEDAGLKRPRISSSTWNEVKVSYIRDGIGPAKLASIFGIRECTIKQKIQRGEWVRERELYKSIEAGVAPGLQGSEDLVNEIKHVTNLTESGKKEVIDDMIGIARTVIKKLQMRAMTLKSDDDKETKWVAETMVKIYDMLEKLLGIGKGEGDTGKVSKSKIQVHVIREAMEQVDELNSRNLDEVGKEG